VRTSSNTPWRTIVGVVADVKNAGLDRPAGTELFFPSAQLPTRLSWVVIKAQGDPMSLVSAARQEVRTLDRTLPISSVGTMDDAMSAARSRPRFLTLLLTMFSSLSLFLAALGIYGVISYAVAQRTNEIGIRMALGAQGGDVIKLIAAAGLRLGIAGTLLGAAGAFALTRFLSGLLFGVSSVDAATFAAMAAVLLLVTLAACYVPARRASRVDPLVALRQE
jgi:putative ABC transport system permease protein